MTEYVTPPIRTFQFFGQGYGDTPVNLVASINGTELFNGTVSTVPVPVPRILPLGLDLADQVLLFSVEFAGAIAPGKTVPTTHGSFPMTVTVSGGDSVILGIIRANYAPLPPDGATNGSPDVFGGIFNGDARSNVAIDGVVQPEPPREEGKKGSYSWAVPAGSTLSCTLNIT
jgi:hypothetical protein